MLQSRLLPSAVLALCALPGAALAQGESKVFSRYTKPMPSVTLDLKTGVLTRGPRVEPRAVGTVNDFPNMDLGGFVGIDSGAGACQWVDAGTKGWAGNRSDLVESVVFAYCSSQLDAASGGVGGSAQLGFYEGYASGGPQTTSPVGVFTLAGLPANTTRSSFFRGFQCYFITLHFGDLLAFADGPIGYSWTFQDVGTDGVLSGTWPFLACVQSCSGPGPDALGMDDSLDQYCPPGSSVRNRFSFGTTPLGSYFTSLAMDIREVAEVEAVVTSYEGDGVNTDRLEAPAMVLGAPWTAAVRVEDDHQASGNASMSLTVRTQCFNGPNAKSPIGGRAVEVLISGSFGLRVVGVHGPRGQTSPFATFTLPTAAALIGVPWAAQATVLGGGFADLTQARCGTLGTVDVIADP